MKLNILYLYWPECPSHEEGLLRLRNVVSEFHLSADIRTMVIETEADAEKYQFAGSPTFIINGKDLDPAAAGGKTSALTCRVYRLPDGRMSPLPSEEMIRGALLREITNAGNSDQ